MKWLRPAHVPVFLFCLLAACGGGTPHADIDTSLIDSSRVPATSDSIVPGRVLSMSCRADASQTYALYVPEAIKSGPLPIVYFFDPHGDGGLPVTRYRSLADRYHMILAGSNNSRNGNDFPTADRIWDALSADTKNRLPLATGQVYVCGFSGGGKVASYLGLQHPGIKSVIAGGAGIPLTGSGTPVGFTFTAIAGTGDMNMTDLVRINDQLDQTAVRHRIIFFNGIHEWAPLPTMDIAFSGLFLDAMAAGTVPVNETLVERFVSMTKSWIGTLLAGHDDTRAEAACRVAISMLTGVSDQVHGFEAQDRSIRESPSYRRQLQVEQDLFTREEAIKNDYQQHFETGDDAYWRHVIDTVRQKAKSVTPEGAMYQRLAAFLSLAFYSISNQLINAQRNEEARHYVDLYKLADPANSEAWYLSAVLDARAGSAALAQADLARAVATGFRDRSRLTSQPEFLRLGNQLNLAQIEQQMK